MRNFEDVAEIATKKRVTMRDVALLLAVRRVAEAIHARERHTLSALLLNDSEPLMGYEDGVIISRHYLKA